ncbi:MAG: hypothetical protein FJ288_06805 [Planctomycetes bacterium]|nr:hypothetical protein [Planctomycetota bacterium]
MPAPSEPAVHVHSVQEEYFYLMVHRCACGGPWHTEAQEVQDAPGQLAHRVEARCFKCRARRSFHFILDSHGGPKGPVRQVNPTCDPSRALDAAEWLDLAQFYLGRIERLKDPVERTQSLLDARQCLEEALKFYGPSDDAPPAPALWSDAGRAKAAASPETFRRAAIEAMLQRIPATERLRQADKTDQRAFERGVRELAKDRVGRRWWEFWRLFRRNT